MFCLFSKQQLSAGNPSLRALYLQRIHPKPWPLTVQMTSTQISNVIGMVLRMRSSHVDTSAKKDDLREHRMTNE